jgi:hypothetical protein
MNTVTKFKKLLYNRIVKQIKTNKLETFKIIKDHFKTNTYGLSYNAYLEESKLKPIFFNILLKKNKLTVRLDKYGTLLIFKGK